MKHLILHGIVEPGYQVASGKGKDSPYPEGAIKMQAPFFKARGVNIDEFYPATINATIKPKTFTILKPDYHLMGVEWTTLHPPENFIFIELEIRLASEEGTPHPWHRGLLYYPDPATKKNHFTVPSRLEILTTYLGEVHYGNAVEVRVSDEKIKILPATK